jgi:hypothetical protein
MNQTIIAMLFCAAALALPSYETLAQPPARKAHIKWVKVNDDEWEPKLRGKYQQAEDGAVLTLPNGNKYITKPVMDNDGPLAILLVFPNRQVFSSYAGGKGDFGAPFVNEDEELIAMTCHPATQTGDLHIYIKEPNGKFRGENGKYRELPNEENGAVNQLLQETYDNFAGWTLEVRGITDRTLTVWAIVKGQMVEKDGGIYRFEFKLHVAPDGKLALVK